MSTRQKYLNFCALLLGTSLTAFANVGYAAKPSPVPASNKPKLKVRVPTDAMRTHGQKVKVVLRPRIIVGSAPDSKAIGSSAVAAKTGALPGSAVITRNLHGSAINTSKVATVVDGRNLNDVSAVKMIDLQAKAAELGRTQLDSHVRGANSATFNALEQLMPGFQDKAKGASSLKEMGTSGHNRNPVTDGNSFANFMGDPSSTMGKGKNSTDNPDGSTTIKNKDGSTTDVWKDGTFYTEKKDGTVVVDHPNGTTDYYGKDGRKIGSTGTSRQIIDPNNPGYYTDGTKVKDSKGSGSAKGNKGGQQGEPIQDDDTSSGPHHITAADLRGLAARLSAAGTPTGEDTSSGGRVDESKTRNGRNGQVGQPTPDATTAVSLPDAMSIKQMLRIRLRNINPVTDR